MVRRTFKRKDTGRSYRKLFVIATEGDRTERQYFNLLRKFDIEGIAIKCLPSRDRSTPDHVLARMQKYCDENKLRDSDQCWLVVDRDNWSEEMLDELAGWARGRNNRGLAVCNPRFEYWLLLHFERGNAIGSAQEIEHRLKKHLQNYDKQIDPRRFTYEAIKEAIERARKRDRNTDCNWPCELGVTTVYRLVERILEQIGDAKK